MLAAAALVALAAVLKAVPYVTLWIDEAMFFVNVRDTAWSQILLPLSYYDQSAPVGYTVLMKLIVSAFRLNEYALRIPSLLAYLGIFAAAATFPRTDRLESTIFAVAILCSTVVLDYSFQAKHYVFELFFIVLVVRSFVEWRHEGKRAWRPFWTTCLAVPFVTTLPIVLAAVGAAWFLEEVKTLRAHRSAHNVQSSKESRERPAWHPTNDLLESARRCLPLVASMTVALVAYWFLVRPAVAPQITNYRYTFDFGFPDGAAFYVRRYLDIIASHYAAGRARSFFGILIGFGFLVAAARGPRKLKIFVLMPAVIVVLNILGQFPLLPGRFSILLLPSLSYFLASGVASLYRVLPRPFSQVVLAIVIALLMLSPLRFIKNPRGQQAKQTIELANGLAEKRSLPLLVTMGSQPILDAYLFADEKPENNCYLAGGTWTNRCTFIRGEGYVPAFLGASTPWFVMVYIYEFSSGKKVRDVRPEQVRTWTTEYVNYVRSAACRSGRAYVVALLNPQFIAGLSSALAQEGTVETVIDENRGQFTVDGRVLYFERTSSSCAVLP